MSIVVWNQSRTSEVEENDLVMPEIWGRGSDLATSVPSPGPGGLAALGWPGLLMGRENGTGQ